MPVKMFWVSMLTIFLNGGLAESSHLRGFEIKPENEVVCLNEAQCQQKFQDMNLSGYFYVNSYPTKGCFSKNNHGFFGTGGTDEEMSETDLPGIQERLWCDKETEVPTAEPSKRPSGNPTAKPVTDSPTTRPTPKPVTDSPTKQPTSKPVTDSPSKQPTAKPVTDSPTKQPTTKPVTDSPTLQPTPTPVTDSPTKQPTPKPVTHSPSKQPTVKPISDSLSKQPTPKPVTDSPTKQPTPKPVAKSPTERTTTNPPTEIPKKQPTSTLVPDSPTKQPTPKPVTDSPANPAANPDTDSPMKKPTTQPVTANSSTANSTAKPVTNRRTEQPTTKPVTDSPIEQPSSKPVTDSPTNQPTANPVTGSPTKQPTTKPVTDSPTEQPSSKPVTDSPTNQPTANPVTDSPTKQSTPKPVTESPTTNQPTRKPTHEPTLNLILTTKPTNVPTEAVDEATEPGAPPSNDAGSVLVDVTPVPALQPLSLKPTRSHTKNPTDATNKSLSPSVSSATKSTSLAPYLTTAPVSSTTAEQGASPSSWYTVPMSPFTLSLQTAPQTNAVDTNELTYLVSNHLLEEMQANFTSTEVTRVNVDISLTSSQLRRLEEDGLEFASDNAASKEHDFTVSGKAYFVGSFIPTTDELDVVIQESFEEESGNEFVHSLQNAEDAGLQSTRSFSVSESANSEDPFVASYLTSNDEDPIVSDHLYVLAIVFGVGFVLVAMYVFKTRRGKRIELENAKNDLEGNDEESAAAPEVPRYIEVANIEVENGNDSIRSRDVSVPHLNKSGDGSCEPEYDIPCSLYGSFQALTAEDESSQGSPEGVSSSAKASNLDTLPQTQPLSENCTVGAGIDMTSQELRSKPPSSNLEPSVGEASDDQSKKTWNTALSENLSLFPLDLPSISEVNDRNQEDNMMCCGGGMGDVNALGTQQRATGTFWGQRPADLASEQSESLQTSRTSHDTRTVSTWGSWDHGDLDLASKNSNPRKLQACAMSLRDLSSFTHFASSFGFLFPQKLSDTLAASMS
eukprot:CAMPEP_0201945044 /NCGR_PEP_ID=MMETSP0903-20130614/53702_1 /ASSEMBLY_ACC=CAM_ASM_000552 /TAXON_ID=420261 /ORGANISM="Thalassiosira antarctica, Strain CCMP982" /LENGTH=1013 /DNA_ID=CAMNT_0048488103 /DNA_START=143 /DNA_END=3185 /DNA_ORIENTATION=+